MSEPEPTKTCRILTLDGGGAKGFYTLGVLNRLEALLGGEPLSSKFDLIFGTSTGAIIASLLALGKPIAEVRRLYEEHVPKIMGRRLARTRTRALDELAQAVYGKQTFGDLKTMVGIVAARWCEERPMIFKSDPSQAHGSRNSFSPGFGCTIADAVVASCSAYPFFNKRLIETEEGEVEVLDGGYCANNPTLYAISEATAALKFSNSQLRVVSIGVGSYPEPRRYFHQRLIYRFFLVRLLQKTLDINTTSMEVLTGLLFKDVPLVRINDTYNTPDMATDLMETDLKKLNLLFQRGGESYAKHEEDLRRLIL